MKNNDFKESAPIFTKRLIDRRVEINSTVRLSCQVYGLPVPTITWYKDGEPLDFAGTLCCRFTTNAKLALHKCKRNYFCERFRSDDGTRTVIHTNDYFFIQKK